MKKIFLGCGLLFMISSLSLVGCSPSETGSSEAEESNIESVEENQTTSESETDAVELVQQLEHDGHEYLLTFPKEYAPDSDDTWPLIVFLHQRGTNINFLENIGMYKAIDQLGYSFVTVSPQGDTNGWDNEDSAAQIINLVEEMIASHQIDASRVYLTGASFGGFGTWYMAAHHPELFAAYAPIAGGGDPSTGSKLVDRPIWVFHNDFDGSIRLEQSQEMVDAVKEAGGENVKFTIYEADGHDAWTETYNNPEFYDWLLSHSLE
ncbi:prolyl oligopeptidase family serine peptidase [Bacillus alkalicellulosilyticus]|uniref:carboxylesterase family protein n=1 Tax=Alkalihalobacterium alkalicellulosilyticum TaxID=1912214 RepID=UPI00148333D9|nr:prolyl oligopeptidase family serine peptidase [Bacillus alkalicellulosilyticus]